MNPGHSNSSPHGSILRESTSSTLSPSGGHCHPVVGAGSWATGLLHSAFSAMLCPETPTSKIIKGLKMHHRGLHGRTQLISRVHHTSKGWLLHQEVAASRWTRWQMGNSTLDPQVFHGRINQTMQELRTHLGREYGTKIGSYEIFAPFRKHTSFNNFRKNVKCGSDVVDSLLNTLWALYSIFHNVLIDKPLSNIWVSLSIYCNVFMWKYITEKHLPF